MTIDEAREILEKLIPQPQRGDGKSITHLMITEALNMAIEVLEQQPCEDCISREAVEKITWEEPSYTDALNVLTEVREKVRALPSVTPKTEWIPCSERLPDTDDDVLCWYEYYHWSREKVLPEYGIGCYLRETSAWCGEVANGKDVRVIAWMPLPEPYKAESEG